MQQETPTKRRSYWHSITTTGPGKQWAGRLILISLFLLPLMAFLAIKLLFDSVDMVTSMTDSEGATLLIHQLRTVGFLFLSVILMLCLLAAYFLFFISVRIFGPQVAVLRFIEQLRSGNYEAFRPLRKDDELKEIMDALQKLAADLRERQGRRGQ
ncbi:MAG: hypothetical protein HC902_08770 [Calothrix sp. SM1_5_4]|nr:hypothetical protein [Calothrix sp. SM1_5_4]